jgi:hypothetical protein
MALPGRECGQGYRSPRCKSASFLWHGNRVCRSGRSVSAGVVEVSRQLLRRRVIDDFPWGSHEDKASHPVINDSRPAADCLRQK